MGNCDCRGLGVSLEWNGSTDDPLLGPILCDKHKLPDTDGLTESEEWDAACGQVEECLSALADVRDLLWPPDYRSDDDSHLGSEVAKAIAERLAFLKPKKEG